MDMLLVLEFFLDNPVNQLNLLVLLLSLTWLMLLTLSRLSLL